MFHGSMVALVTPMSSGEVDVAKLQELVEWHIYEGTHAIIAAGTTGESGTLSHDEKLLVIKTVIEVARERIPVIAGTSANATRDCIALTKEAMMLGAHAALIMTPAYIRPTQEGLFQHYQQVAAEVAMPIILYNVPSRTACDLLPETVARLAKISNIIGIKEATGQIERLSQILSSANGRLDVYSGDDPSAASWLLAGAKGVISVTANVAPKMMAKMCELGLDADFKACLDMQEALLPLHHLMFVESNPIPVKWALSQMGKIGPELRLPMTPLSPSHHEAMRAVLSQLQLI